MDKKKLTRKEKFSTQPNPAQTSLNKTSERSWLPGLIIAILGFVLYANTISHQYALDDYSIILENRVTKQGVSAIPEIFKSSYRSGYYFSDDKLYRPIVKSMFAIEWGISPENASLSHFINVLLFAFTGFFLFKTLTNLTEGRKLFAFIAAALFIAHPIHTEVVANIKSRDEILALLFSIVSLNYFLNYVRLGKTGNMIKGISCFFVALLSKESAITFLAVFPLAGWFFTSEKVTVLLKKTLPFAGVAILFLLIRSAVLSGIAEGSVSVADNLLMAAKDPLSRFATAVYILGLYLKLLIFPHPLVFDYSYNQIPILQPGDFKFIISFLVYAGLFAFAVLKFKSKNIFSFSILLFIVTISIYSNILIMIGSSMGERFLYAPSLAFCIAMAALLVKTGNIQSDSDSSLFTDLRKNIPLLASLVVLLSLYSFRTITRNPVWANNFTLYSNDVKLSPNSTRTHYYLGNYLIKAEALEGKSEEEQKLTIRKGIEELQKSIDIYSRFSDSHLQMGVAYYKLNNLDSALICYKKALEINPKYATVYNNIGTVYFGKQNFTEALSYFLKAVELDNSYAEAHMNAGSAYGMLQNYDQALNSLFTAVRFDPNLAQAYYFIGITYQIKGDQQNANAYLEKAYKLNPELRPKK